MTSRDPNVFAVVTGGGTSGHVVPAISVLEQLQDAGVDASRLRYVGSRRGVETRLMNGTGVESVFLPISGLQRSLRPRALMKNAMLPVRLFRSVRAARVLVARWKPQVVVSVGGYASEPMARAAIRAGVPLVCVSYDRVAGLATRLQSRHATACAVAFADTDLPNKVITGAPVRRDVRNLDIASRRESARAELGVARDVLLVTVVGGSLGSGILNGAVPSLLTALVTQLPHRVGVYHLCGARNVEDPEPEHAEGVWYRRAGYDDRMAEIYAASDLVVCRAGASTIAEIAAVGVASVVVPWSGAAEDHQEHNAAWLGDADAAVVLSESAVSDGRLPAVVVELLTDHDKRNSLASAARSLGATSRSDALARMIVRAATNKSRPDLTRRRRIHVVGVAGPGMSAIAIVLAQMGHDVSGSDIRESDTLTNVRRAGVRVIIGQTADNVEGVDIVTYSTGVPLNNVEIVTARNRGILVLHRSAMLAAICARTSSFAVAGTHGKTTTSALLAFITETAGMNPSFLIGAEVESFGTGARWVEGSILVVEADESDGTHDTLPLTGSILTNVDKDHLDHFGTMKDMSDSFVTYIERLSGPAVVCGDDANVSRILTSLRDATTVVTYGTGSDCHYRVDNFRTMSTGVAFRVVRENTTVEVELPLFGLHNALNCAGAMAMADQLGVPLAVSARAVANFGGVDRRCQLRGEFNGAQVIDDYAHVPTEIESVLRAMRQRYGGQSRLVAVFQPNRFHRIAEMHRDYADCFEDADVTVITDVYASGTPRIEGVTGKLIVDDIVAAHPGSVVVWAKERRDVVEYLRNELRPGDVCIGMGCGDIETLADDLRDQSR